MGTAEQLVAKIESWIPMVETPRGSNRVPVCDWFGPVGGAAYYAWCAAGAYEGARQTGTPLFKTASVGEAIAAAKRGAEGAVWLPPSADLRIGDMACEDYGPFHGEAKGDWARFHVHTVRNPSTQRKYETVGCNEVDSIRIAWNDRTYLMGAIRPAYTAPPPVLTPPPSPEEDDVILKQIAWTKPGSKWAKRVIGNNTQSHAVMLYESGIVTHIEDGNSLSLMKAWGIKDIGQCDDALFLTYTFAAERIS